MSNGLGAGFAALSLLAVLGGLAAVSVLATGGAALIGRRAGRLPTPLRYLSVAVGVQSSTSPDSPRSGSPTKRRQPRGSSR